MPLALEVLPTPPGVASNGSIATTTTAFDNCMLDHKEGLSKFKSVTSMRSMQNATKGNELAVGTISNTVSGTMLRQCLKDATKTEGPLAGKSPKQKSRPHKKLKQQSPKDSLTTELEFTEVKRRHGKKRVLKCCFCCTINFESN